MIVTEEEAKQKRCCGPEGCGSPVIAVDGKWEADLPTGTMTYKEWKQYSARVCIGAQCMAWKWAVLHTYAYDAAGHEIHSETDTRQQGFCGYVGG